MFFPRRKCCVFFRKLLVVSILACCCVSLLNLLCFNGECNISEKENKALSSLSEVVLQANQLSSHKNGQFSEMMASASSKANTEGIVIRLLDKIFLNASEFWAKLGGVQNPGPGSNGPFHLI